MDVPNIERPICEPVELAPAAPLRVVRVREGRAAMASKPFTHFHSAFELVVFGAVSGSFDLEDRRYRLVPGSVAFVTTMRQHDFALAAGPRDWVLVQIEAATGETLSRLPGLGHLRDSFCVLPDVRLRRHLRALCGWLIETGVDDPLALSVVELLLRAVASAPPVRALRRSVGVHGLRRLRPAIDRLREAPAAAPGAEEAAALCAMSTAYFSRRFKQQVGMSWSDYVRTHRLHLASRRLLESRAKVAAIAIELGFATPSHFGEVFRQRFGMTPGAYRRSGRHADAAGTRIAGG